MKTVASQLSVQIGNLRAENHELRINTTHLEWLLANAHESLQEQTAEIERLRNLLIEREVCPDCGNMTVEVDEDGRWFCTSGLPGCQNNDGG